MRFGKKNIYIKKYNQMFSRSTVIYSVSAIVASGLIFGAGYYTRSWRTPVVQPSSITPTTADTTADTTTATATVN